MTASVMFVSVIASLLQMSSAFAFAAVVSDVGNLCNNGGHHIGSMETGELCYVLDLQACFGVMVVACGVADVRVVVSVRRSAVRFH